MKERVMIQKSQAFTLIELMVVLVVMGIIMGIAIPSFTTMGAGASLEHATRMLSGQVRLARQLAISQRKYVGVIMPRAEDGAILERYQYACFRSAILRRSGTTYTFHEWVPRTKWSFLSTGVSIMEADGDTGIQSGAWSLNPADNNNSEVDDVDLSRICTTGGNAVDGVRAVILAPTGRVRFTAAASVAIITLGEALYVGGNWIVKNEDTDPATDNKSCKNQLSIHIDSYTGRSEVKAPTDY